MNSKSSRPGQLPWKDGGVYLITGGIGGLGKIFAREIIQHVRSPKIVLAARSVKTASAQAVIEDLMGLGEGVNIGYLQMDVTNRPSVELCIASIVRSHGTIDGILHSAGVVKDSFITKKRAEEFSSVVAPKLLGAFNLDLVTSNLKLDFFILFSSIAAVLGNAGQSDYATANAFMDRFAARRSRLVRAGKLDGRTLSINWPLWHEGGMRLDEASLERIRQRGVEVLPTTVGMEALYRAWCSGESNVCVLLGSRNRISHLISDTDPMASTDNGNNANESQAGEGKQRNDSDTAPLTAEIDSRVLDEKMRNALIRIVSTQLKVKAKDIDEEAEFSEFGFDSISFTEFSNTLNELLGLELSPAIFFEYSTIKSLSGYLVEDYATQLRANFFGVPVPTTTRAHTPVAERTAAIPIEADVRRTLHRDEEVTPRQVAGSSRKPGHEPIAIIGMSGRFPQASDLEAFWDNLKSGKDCITEIPSSRWDWRALYGDPTKEENKTNIKWGGFIEGVDEFDPLFFGISPREAVIMDPQHRLLLTFAWRAIEDAGYSSQSLSGSRTGVFIATGNTGYSELIAQGGVPVEAHTATGSVPSVGPNRLSYLLNLRGPSEPIETACSSSLVAMHRAVRAIHSGDCEMALAGGISTIVTPVAHISFSKAGMLCEDGRCKTFSKDANGYVRGEGVGILFLKRLSVAEHDGDQIYGVIRGTAENHGGRAHSLTAPNPHAQAELIQAAWLEANLDPRTAGYIEAHGTGTALGDPIEVNSLKAAFAEMYDANGAARDIEPHCGIGSVKTNIGHTELAAGVAGVIKVLLQLKHRTLVKSLHCQEINPYIQLRGSPFYVVADTQPWKAMRDENDREIPRRAGVSSFGFGGVNAHIVIEEYCSRPGRDVERRSPVSTPDNPVLIVLSAKNETQLRAQAAQLLAHVERHDYTTTDLISMAYTLQVGRDAMDVRLAFTAVSFEELVKKLTGYLDGQAERGEVEEFYLGTVKDNVQALAIINNDQALQTAISAWTKSRNYTRLLDLWTKGLAFDWHTLYVRERPQRMSLPTYPFERRRLWIERKATPTVADASDAEYGAAPSKAAEFYSLGAQVALRDFQEEYLTFCPFEQKIPSFSMTRVFLNPDKYPQEMALVRRKQRELRQVLFCKENFSAVNHVFDIGCGHGTDVIQLAEVYGHVRTDGFTITKAQADLGQQRIVRKGLESRARIFFGNSTVDEFPGRYDLIIGIEVACHISDKGALFKNIATALRQDGRVLLMDFIANLQGPIEDPSVQISIATEADWLSLFAANRLRIDEIIDVSPQIANFSHDPDFEKYVRDLPEVARASCRVFANQSIALEKGWISYCLFKLSMAHDLPLEDLVMRNADKVRYKRSYPDALQEMQSSGHDGYPVDGAASVRAGSEGQGDRPAAAETASREPFELMTFIESWEEQVLDRLSAGDLKTIVCFSSDRDLQQAIAAATRSANSQTRIVFVANRHVAEPVRDFPCYQATLDTELDACFHRIQLAHGNIDAILYLWPLEEPRYVKDYSLIIGILHAIASNHLACRRVLLAAQFSESLDRCYAESWLGFERSIGQVLPGMALSSVYALTSREAAVDAHAWAERLANELFTENFESSLYSDGKRYVLRTRRAALEETTAEYAVVRRGGTYFVTGGMGGLGLVFATHLARRGAANLILVGRSRLDDVLQTKINDLQALGAKVLYLSLDVCSVRDLQEGVAQARARFGPIHGVIHAAGVAGSASILANDVNVFNRVVAPKIQGTLALTEAINGEALDFQCYFSSSSAILGDFGSCDYAVGNRFQMAHAAHLSRSNRGKTVVINWPFWQDGGLGKKVGEVINQYLLGSGQRAVQTPEGIDLYERLISQTHHQHLVLAAQWSRAKRFLRMSSPLASKRSNSIKERTAPRGVTGAEVKTELTSMFCKVLQLQRSDFNDQTPFSEIGVSSINAVELLEAINTIYDLRLPTSIIFQFSSIATLSEYVADVANELAERLPTLPSSNPRILLQESRGDDVQSESISRPDEPRGERSGLQSARDVTTCVSSGSTSTDIAIIGLACRCAGADDQHELWDLLSNGRECIHTVKDDSWLRVFARESLDVEVRYGAMEGIDHFDAEFFRISPHEGQLMDPSQRILLEQCYSAIEDAGYAPRSLQAKNVGVFIGSMQSASAAQEASHFSMLGNETSILAARISYFLDLKGPALAVNTACSSSLVAMDLCCQKLKSGEIDLGIAGGITIYTHPLAFVSMFNANMLSPTGRCRPFDDKADGIVVGDGVGVVILKRLVDAERDNDRIYGVIRGSGTNQDGKTSGITVPSFLAQSHLEESVYRRSQIDARKIQYIEAHGTATKLGDPIEVHAITSAFRKFTDDKQFCAIGSIKGNIGHTTAAAGVLSVIKVCLSLQHRQIPASINFHKTNQHIDFDSSPVYVNSELRSWPENGSDRRLAVVSSFGFSGTNAHMVIEEYCAKREMRYDGAPEEPLLIVLSARTAGRLVEQVKQLLNYLHAHPESDLGGVSYTLQVGRDAMEHRLAVLANTTEEVQRRLEDFIHNKRDNHVLHGCVRSMEGGTTMLDDDDASILLGTWLERRRLDKLASAWIAGLDIDWSRLYSAGRYSRLSLPTYPFLKDIFPTLSAGGAAIPSSTTASVLHPLLHCNTSTLDEQRFTSTWNGEESFLKDHLVHGEPVLPGMCYIEMVRAALEFSVTRLRRRGKSMICLRNVVWAQPVKGKYGREVCIRLMRNESAEIEYTVYSSDPTHLGADNDAGDGSIVHSQGRARVIERPETEILDLAEIKSRCDRAVDIAECYAAFGAMGLQYGVSYQGLRRAWFGYSASGDPCVVAEIQLPECARHAQSQYVLHPSFLDSALQASIAVVLPRSGNRPVVPRLPFAVDAIDVFDATPTRGYVYIQERADATQDPVKGVDVDICDEQGRICVRMRGFTSRLLESGVKSRDSQKLSPVAQTNDVPSGEVRLVPHWEAVKLPIGSPWPEPRAAILVIGAAGEHERILKYFPRAKALELTRADSTTNLRDLIQAQGHVDHLLWLVPGSCSSSLIDDRVLEEQGTGVMGGFRLVKALLEAGYGPRTLGLTVITRQTQSVDDSATRPAHASIHGLIGSLAKEYAHWQLRLVDVPEDNVLPIEELLRLPPDPQGNAWAYRGGEWYRQHLMVMTPSSPPPAQFRRNGLYVVIGGAGGIGEVLTEYLVRNYHAQVVWIGRRGLDTEIQTKIERISTLGPAPVYLRADATDRGALDDAHRTIRSRHGQVNGVVHAALVLADRSLAQMDEERFTAGFASKASVTLRLAQVFGSESLDFLLFFSSVQTFTKAAGQSNYAAGCTFQDAYAQQLAQMASYPVKIMNWGYWGSVGAVASEEYRARMAELGIASIEPSEAMRALEEFLASRYRQMALIRTNGTLDLPGVDKDRNLVQLPLTAGGVSAHAVLARTAKLNPGPLLTDQAHVRQEFEASLAQVLRSQLQSLGLFDEEQLTRDPAGVELWRQRAGIPELYKRWLHESLRQLREGYRSQSVEKHMVSPPAAPESDTGWFHWEQQSNTWRARPELAAHVSLVDATLRELPSILTGRKRATDVLFPEASLERVERIYKDNPVADYFNAVLCEALVACVEERLQDCPSAGLRILEIGAGTGGTSAQILEKLKPYAHHVEEYCYTDVSQAFLLHAEERYIPIAPFLKTSLLDIEYSLSEQGIEEGGYDIVIAANVLHATKNIRKTLRNAKAALKGKGVLLLNEITERSLFAHLTFGLLEGWWLYEDDALRLPGSPVLDSRHWRKVLAEEGFGPILFPVLPAEFLGQQIIMAESDGLIRKVAAAAASTSINNAARVVPPVTARAPIFSNAENSASAQTDHPQPEQARSLDDCVILALNDVMSETLRMPASRIDPNEPLERYGIDSILAVRLTKALSKFFPDISSTAFFEYPNIRALATHLIRSDHAAATRWVKLECAVPPAVQPPVPPIVARSGADNAVRARYLPQAHAVDTAPPVAPVAQHVPCDVAIVGLSGKYPQAADLRQFWENLRSGRNCITEIPPSRWDHGRYFHPERGIPGKSYSKWGGFIDGIDEFDPLFFRIAPKEAAVLDPQERLFLEQAHAAIEDAGYTPESLCATKKVGVFVGVMNSTYARSSAYWSIANRVNYVFDFNGPSIAVDTACSSSLTAIHLALESIHSHSCEVAIAGGVNLIVDPVQYTNLSAMGMLSSGDRCRSFGDQADGFVDSEGVGALVLKPIAKAIADGDHVYGVIRATAVNTGGHTSGYTVPNPVAQAAVVTEALQRSRIDARWISYVEAHGTGTSLGDPIEIAGLTRAFGEHTNDRQFCAVGSVKSNIGHCESAAGIAGLTKVLLQMQHGMLVPSLHAEALNPHIAFDKTPFKVQRQSSAWLRPTVTVDGRQIERPRIAGVGSFGAGGANAYLIVEEFIDTQVETAECGGLPALIVLSARNHEQLRARVRQLLDYLDAHSTPDLKLSDLAFTLQVGRQAMDHRLACSVSSSAELRAILSGYLDSNAECGEPRGCYIGDVQENKGAITALNADADTSALIDLWIEKGKYGQLLELWTKGLVFNWHSLYVGAKPRRMSLPTYPFAKQPFWSRQSSDEVQPPAAADSRSGFFEATWSEAEVTTLPLPPVTARLLVIGATDEELRSLRSLYSNTVTLQTADWASIDTLIEALGSVGPIDRVIWITPVLSLDEPIAHMLSGHQDQGVIQCFRLIKALLQLSYDVRELAWSVVTFQAQPVLPEESVAPTHAGLHGLMGSLAKEYAHWHLGVFDFAAIERPSLEALLQLPADPKGDVLACRAGRWYRQQLVPSVPTQSEAVAYCQEGVYVIIGGSGGIGVALSEHLISTYRARVIWIGRRALDAQISSNLERLSRQGLAPEYMCADATDLDALQRVRLEIIARYGRIHGVVHAAVAIADKSLALMDEARFTAGFSAKADVSVRVAQVFATDPLDFMCFFSSIQSFAKFPGQSNYAAGCTFKDAFAQCLARRGVCPIKIMNWGYWGSVGVAAGTGYAARIAKHGLASIEAADGMAALQTLLTAPMTQLAYVRTLSSPVLPTTGPGVERTIESAQMAASPMPVRKVPDGEIAALPKVDIFLQLSATSILRTFQSLGYFLCHEKSIESADVCSEFRAQGRLQARVLDTQLRVLIRSGLIALEGDRLRLEEHTAASALDGLDARYGFAMRAVPEMAGLLTTVKALLESYGEILAGRSAIDTLVASAGLARAVEQLSSLRNARISKFDLFFYQGIYQNLASLKDRGRLTVVDLDWVLNPVRPVIVEFATANQLQVDYFCITLDEQGRLLSPAAGASLAVEHNAVHIHTLPDETQIVEALGTARADVLILQDDAGDLAKLDRQLTLAKRILQETGVIIASSHPLYSVIGPVMFWPLDKRLLADTPAHAGGIAAEWVTQFATHGFQVEPAFGDWLMIAQRQARSMLGTVTPDRSPSLDRANIETKLVSLFAGVLQMNPADIDIATDLHAYGLDSILITNAFMLLKREFGDRLNPRIVTSSRSIRELAAYIDRQTVTMPKEVTPSGSGAASLLAPQNFVSEEVPAKRRVEPSSSVEILITRPHTDEFRFDDSRMTREMIIVASRRRYEVVSTGTGPTIMFLTGLAFSWRIWRTQILALAARYRLIFPHLPGHGASVADDSEFSFDGIADDLADVLQHYQLERVHVLGWCMGGNVAQLFAHRHPGKVASLILVGTTPLDARLRGVNTDDLVDYSVNPVDGYMMEFRNALGKSPFQDQITRLYLSYLEDSYNRIESFYTINYVNRLFQFDSSTWLNSIEAPTLVIAGLWDIAFPPDQVQLLHQGIRNSRFIEMENSGHLPFLTESERFNLEVREFTAVASSTVPQSGDVL